MRKSKLLTLSLFSVLLFSCASLFEGEQIQDVDKPIQLIRYSIVQAFPTGNDQVLEKGRFYISQPFSVKRGGKLTSVSGKYRYIAEVRIRGGRRPYTLDVMVRREVHIGDGDYRQVDTDQRIVRIMSKNIQKELSKRRKNRNIIDDFRVF